MTSRNPDLAIGNHVLEIGVGANDFIPLPTILVGLDGKVPDQNFHENRRYIGIDMPLNPSRSWRNMHQMMAGGDAEKDENSRQTSGEIAAALADTKQNVAWYRDASYADFMLADAFDLPFRGGSFSQVYMANVIGSQMLDNSIDKILKESRRVLVDVGKLIIRETITPHWVPEDLPDFLDRAGFSPTLQVFNYHSPEYGRLVDVYGLSNEEYEDNDSVRENYFFAIGEAA